MTCPQVELGWREWLALPELGIPAIKTKIDTGARTSALHAFVIEPFHSGTQLQVRFGIHPLQKRTDIEIYCEAEVIDRRLVSDMGLNVVGVDLLRANRSPVIMEVNSSPGLEAIKTSTGKNIAGMIIAFLERHVTPGRTRTQELSFHRLNSCQFESGLREAPVQILSRIANALHIMIDDMASWYTDG